MTTLAVILGIICGIMLLGAGGGSSGSRSGSYRSRALRHGITDSISDNL